MKNAAIIATVDAPKVSLASNEEAGELLLHFYRALGWNGSDFLDPSKIRTTQEVCDRLHNQMRERHSNALNVGLFMMNSGPGVDNHIKPGKVHLLKGWVTPCSEEGVYIN